MNKKVKDIIALALLAFALFLLPTVMNIYFVERRTDTFYSRVDEDFEDCVKNANADDREVRLCKEIKRSSELAFRSANQVSGTNFDSSVTRGILFVFGSMIIVLKRRIDNLEKD